MSESLELLNLQITIDKAKVSVSLARREQELHTASKLLAIYRDQVAEVEKAKERGASYERVESLESQARQTWGRHIQAEQRAEVALEEAESALAHAEWAVKVYNGEQ